MVVGRADGEPVIIMLAEAEGSWTPTSQRRCLEIARMDLPSPTGSGNNPGCRWTRDLGVGASCMMRTLTRSLVTALVLLSLGPARDALAETTEADQRMVEARQKSPADSFVVMEAKLFEGDSTTEKTCRTMNVTMTSGQGKTVSILTQELLLFDKASDKFGGGVVLPPGTYTIVQITCESHRYRGSFARFTLQAPQAINLGCLIVEYRSSPFNPLAYPTYSGHSRVVDLSPNAVASLTKRVPTSFAGAIKRHMTPILVDSNAKTAR
jgi:hypothetical protein